MVDKYWMIIKRTLKTLLTNRHFYAGLLVFVVSTVMIGRLYDLQIKQGDALNTQAGQTSFATAELIVKARRGDIYDRNGILLATTRVAYKVNMVNYKMEQSMRDEMYLALVQLFEANNDVYANNLKRYITPDIEWGSAFSGENKDTALNNWLNTIVSGFSKSDKEKIKTARDAYDYLRNTVFELDEKYTDDQAYQIMIIRYQTHFFGLSYLTPTELASDVCAETVEYLSARYFDFPGITTEETYFRVYTDAAAASHLLGYVRAISDSEYEEMKAQGYTKDDLIGKIGIEKAAEADLRGVNGTRVVYRDEKGVIRTQSYTPPIQGNDVYLTIDYNLQKACADSLQATLAKIAAGKNDTNNFGDANAGSVVVMNVKTAEVIAMANYPYYDNSIFIAPSTDKEAQQAIVDLFQDPTSPSLNRATQGLYPVGSVVKPAVSVAAMMEGKISSSESILCNKEIRIGEQPHSCLSYHGNIALRTALARSCNIYFYQAGIRVGIDALDSWFQKFGLGEKSGIEISEYAGSRSNVETMQEREEDTTHIWSDSDTAQTAIGQLYTLFTPLQLCRYTAAIANGGQMKTPHLIHSVLDNNGKLVWDNSDKANASVDLGISSYILSVVQDGMKLMIQESPQAQSAFVSIPPGFVAGKSGTPETGLEDLGQSSHALLICYAPADDPEIAISVVLEHGVFGGMAFPVIRTVLDEYFGDRLKG